jgi:hypothetical protein
MSSKFDIFPLIKKLNIGNVRAFEQLSPDEQQQASPFMAMKFMSGCMDRGQIVALNQVVNPYIFTMNNKPLLFKLLAVSASKRVSQVKWPGQMKEEKNLPITIISKFYDCSCREAKLMLPNFTLDQIVEMAETVGSSDEEIKKLRKP